MKNFKKAQRVTGVAYLLFVTTLNGCGLTLRQGATNKIDLERIFAPVRTYDCDGNLTSEETKEISSPSRWVRIYSELDDPSILNAEVSNRTLPENNTGVISYSGNNYISILLHYSDTFVGFQVKNGINEIDYHFEHGSYSPQESESGTMIVDINYIETYKSTIRHDHPSEETCENLP